MSEAAVHVIVPDWIDDPLRPSGGSVYDRKVCQGLAAAGWSVHEHRIPGCWPTADDAAHAALAAVVAAIPDRSAVLVDGLIGSASPDELGIAARRLRVVVLVHLPLGVTPRPHQIGELGAAERVALAAASAIVTPSRWTRRWLIDNYALAAGRIGIAEPGADSADLAPGTPAGRELICVAAVVPSKGHDVLLRALAGIADLDWRCVCVGSVSRDPRFVAELQAHARMSGLADRVTFQGPRTAPELGACYAAADALVLASRGETYGMVVTEALARGLPAVVTDVGGVAEALGAGSDGIRPGILVPADDPAQLAKALRRWLEDPDLRQRLRLAARDRRGSLVDWLYTSEEISRVLTAAAT